MQAADGRSALLWAGAPSGERAAQGLWSCGGVFRCKRLIKMDDLLFAAARLGWQVSEC